MALRACSSSGLEKVSSLRLVFPLSSDDPGPWDPRDPVAVEPSLCPSMFQDLAESGLLKPEAAPVSTEVTRATRLNNLFNTCNLSRLGYNCLSKRLDAIFDPSRIFVRRAVTVSRCR